MEPEDDGEDREGIVQGRNPGRLKTVGRLLKELGYSLRVNHKKIGVRQPQPAQAQGARQAVQLHWRDARIVCTPQRAHHQRRRQEERAHRQLQKWRTPWEKEATPVYDHDFPSDAVGRVAPYGIYDTQANRGFICVGTSAETPAFAVDSIERWWKEEGQDRYPCAAKLLILADCGGGNSARSRVWKYRLQKQLCDAHRLSVTVCHYPPGASKGNPIEHRVFSEISKNWAGRPLLSFQTALHYIRTSKTSSGLRVRASSERNTKPASESYRTT